MDAEKLSYRELIKTGTDKLKEANIEEAETDTWYLLEAVSGLSRAEYFLRSEYEADIDEVEEFLRLIERRSKRIPLSYILGNRDFMGFTFKVNEDVLIPEQETELLVEEVLKCCDDKSVLDLCTGSGCIAISISLLGKPSKIVGLDISKRALEVAKENALLLKASAVDFLQSDLFDKINEKFDIIVSNPPYIETDVIEKLQPEVRDYIPRLALDGDKDGLKFYRKISESAPKYLNKNAVIFYEIGYNQGGEVSDILYGNGFTDIRIIKDYSGLDRIVMANFKG
ncbi:MAG: peptide chain release factor N(5)-glutamine methyltransferase [Catonella sp.]|uniref:peptide chain release factor N(5)-glutamine methyltransferase n=1 Tax=Catonella sp. TaxID=2382125 RepID=UPI003F9FC022